MDLKEGSSQEIVRDNVRSLIGSGHDPKQAIAMALTNAYKFKKTESLVQKDESPVSMEANETEVLAEALSPEPNKSERFEEAKGVSEAAKAAIAAKLAKRKFA